MLLPQIAHLLADSLPFFVFLSSILPPIHPPGLQMPPVTTEVKPRPILRVRDQLDRIQPGALVRQCPEDDGQRVFPAAAAAAVDDARRDGECVLRSDVR